MGESVTNFFSATALMYVYLILKSLTAKRAKMCLNNVHVRLNRFAVTCVLSDWQRQLTFRPDLVLPG